MTVTVDTECHHCSEPFTLEIDNDMHIVVDPPDATPLVFVPDVVPFDVAGPDIIDDF
mgnify:CR=1 FL=1